MMLNLPVLKMPLISFKVESASKKFTYSIIMITLGLLPLFLFNIVESSSPSDSQFYNLIATILFLVSCILVWFSPALLIFGFINAVTSLPGVFKEIKMTPIEKEWVEVRRKRIAEKRIIVDFNKELESVILDYDHQKYNKVLAKLNNLLEQKKSLSLKELLFINSVIAHGYFHQGDYEKSYTYIKPVVTDRPQLSADIQDDLIKYMCEIKLNKPEESIQTINEAQSIFQILLYWTHSP